MRVIRGKSALVTGAASGIGRAIALRLADEGARLYLVDVNASGLAAVVSEAVARGAEAIGRQCDLAQPSEISAATADVLRRWGVVDILVNNAGVTYYGRIYLMTPEHWNHLMAINLHAPTQLTRELLPAMLNQGQGHIVNVASALGLVGLSRVVAYSTSKFGLVGFYEALRAEVSRKGIGVTALCPGLVDTNLFSAANRGRDYQKKSVVPPRWLLTTPERIADHAIKAIIRNRGTVVIQPYAKAIHLFKRLAPGILDWSNRLKLRKRKPSPYKDVMQEFQNKAA